MRTSRDREDGGGGGRPWAQEGQQEPQGGVGGRRLGRMVKGTAKGREHQAWDRLPQTLTGPGPAVLGAQGTMGGSSSRRTRQGPKADRCAAADRQRAGRVPT